eukprot:5266010-Lingulodinium_polyedra.AAC.1
MLAPAAKKKRRRPGARVSGGSGQTRYAARATSNNRAGNGANVSANDEPRRDGDGGAWRPNCAAAWNMALRLWQ